MTYRLEAEKCVIEGVGKTLAGCSDATRALWSGSAGFADAAAAMPGSAFSAACAGKDDVIRTLLGRAAARMDAVSQTCYQVATEFADTDGELASGFRAISVF
ncbi:MULTISPECIES: hypothetical protein [Gordonia]|uniref:Uncharacterized protein n=2 Tax=Gordonia alkanivorans TaxID=84096 RepID=F9VR02_9ACTN|nr:MULTISPECIES: hypothetical protein [Gordonia]AZZ82136.1 hypothetical protein C5O27_14545 [Gordonia alkanivorans]ETA06388.1 hypothetical protein V525_13065 [Gordonia alkanivorans CGMCC 6845]MDH3006584.1 hypothetical protein [Gordonia alkanivorans]MDH3009898.1 hypothetical protein [Gordonia alkanivorans]MDH3014341.1 hypothetical protein [Gordonia alkanivorans]